MNNGSDQHYQEHPAGQQQETLREPVIDLGLDIPSSELDFDLSAIIGPSAAPETEKVQKRASNVMKLSKEHEKLKEELRAMTERLEAAERKQQELQAKVQQPPAAAQR